MSESLEIMTKKVMSKINSMDEGTEIDKYLLMFFAGTSRYEKINPIIAYLKFVGVIEEISRDRFRIIKAKGDEK